MTLTEFLTARLDEDEAVASAAVGMEWVYDIAEAPADPEGGNYIAMIRAPLTGDSWNTVAAGWAPHAPDGDGLGATLAREEGDHVARHDPARVLAEVEAKRRIVALHSEGALYSEGPFRGDGFCETCHDYDQHVGVKYPCPTLRLLALPYADHPDYDEAWRP